MPFVVGQSLITINVWGIHHSKEVWGDDAHEFRPERFDSAEARKRNPFAFLAFSAGKRNCIGKVRSCVCDGVVVYMALTRDACTDVCSAGDDGAARDHH